MRRPNGKQLRKEILRALVKFYVDEANTGWMLLDRVPSFDQHFHAVTNICSQLNAEGILESEPATSVAEPVERVRMNFQRLDDVRRELTPWWRRAWVRDWVHILLTAAAVLVSIIALVVALRAAHDKARSRPKQEAEIGTASPDKPTP